MDDNNNLDIDQEFLVYLRGVPLRGPLIRGEPFTSSDIIRFWEKNLNPVQAEAVKEYFCKMCPKGTKKIKELQETLAIMTAIAESTQLMLEKTEKKVIDLRDRLDKAIEMAAEYIRKEGDLIDRIDYLEQIPKNAIEYLSELAFDWSFTALGGKAYQMVVGQLHQTGVALFADRTGVKFKSGWEWVGGVSQYVMGMEIVDPKKMMQVFGFGAEMARINQALQTKIDYVTEVLTP